MQGIINLRVVAALVFGVLLIGSALFVRSNQPAPVTGQVANTPVALARVPIPVQDNDGNGIEDWRDEFITTKPIIINKEPVPYTPPDTVTGQLGIAFIQDILEAKAYGPFSRTTDEVIDDTVDQLSQHATDKLYEVADIDIMETWDSEDVVNYANTLAASVYRHNQSGLPSELLILKEVLQSSDSSRIAELEQLSAVYQNYRDDALKIPVPKFLAKGHLDLINTFHALHQDIEGMSLALEDPAITLMRLKRYQDDAAGLGFAIQNLVYAIEPYADQFSEEDPALLFAVFHPDYQL